MKLKWFPNPPSVQSDINIRRIMQDFYEREVPTESAGGTFHPEEPVVTWLSRINAASLHLKCGTKMSLAPLQQAHAVFKIASVQQQYGKFHAAV
jgi:hypothetical protein